MMKNIEPHMQAKAKAAYSKQAPPSSETFDKNRGSDTGGTNTPKGKNASVSGMKSGGSDAVDKKGHSAGHQGTRLDSYSGNPNY